MHRRAFVLLTGAAVTAPALDLLLDGAGPLRAAQDGDRVTAQLAQVVQRTVRQARDLDDSEGSISALLWADGIWQNLAKILTHSRYRTPEGVRLHTSYIEMSETYGWMLFDAGKHPQAQRVYQTGLRLARQAENHIDVHRATVNLLASAAYQACWLGQHHEADTLLSVARNHRPHVLTPRLRAVLADREITLAGALGDTERVHRADNQAREHLSAALEGHELPVTRWLAVPADAATAGEGGRRCGRGDLKELRDTAEQARLWDARFGGGDWRLSSVTQCLRDRAIPMLTGTHTEQVGRELFTIAAELSRVVAWATFDSGVGGRNGQD